MRTQPQRRGPEPRSERSNGTSQPGQPTEPTRGTSEQDPDRGRALEGRGVSSHTNIPQAPPELQPPPRPERTAATLKQYTCRQTLHKLPGSIAGFHPRSHPHFHSRRIPKCYASIEGVDDGISESCPHRPMRSLFLLRGFIPKCYMHRGPPDTSNGSPSERGSSQRP